MKSAVKREGQSRSVRRTLSRPGAPAFPGCGPWSAISTTTARWCWSIRRWRSPRRPRPPTPRWCAPSRRWASPGCASLSRPWSAGSAPRFTSAEKMRSTVTALSSDVNSSIDFVLEGHQRVCEVLSRADNRAAVAQAVALLSDARQVGSSASAPRGSSPSTPPGCSAALACRRM